jgi:hypothetical protein
MLMGWKSIWEQAMAIGGKRKMGNNGIWLAERVKLSYGEKNHKRRLLVKRFKMADSLSERLVEELVKSCLDMKEEPGCLTSFLNKRYIQGDFKHP